MAKRTFPPTGNKNKPEDFLLYELLSVLRGERPDTAMRMQYAGFAGARKGGSANHPDMALAAQVVEGSGPARRAFLEQRADRTDFGMNEPWSKNEYGRWSLSSSLAVYRKTKAAAVREWCEHFLAGLIAMSTAPTDWKRNVVGMAGARSGKRGFHGVGWPELVVELSQGGNVPSQLKKAANGRRENWPEDYSSALLFELAPEIIEIAAPIWAAFRREGFPGLERFLRYGTRVEHRILRTRDWLAVYLGTNCNGNTPPTWAFVHFFDGGWTFWHPDTDEHVRQKFDGGHAGIENGVLVAVSEFFGTFKWVLPPSPLVLDVRQYAGGCTVAVEHLITEQPVRTVAGTLYERPNREPWWRRLF